MKKLFVSALAIVSMVACSMDETVNTQAPASIAFDGAFVEKATRAEDPSTTTQNINEFYVWAVMNDVDGLVFNGEAGEKVWKSGSAWTYENIQYWVPNNHYYFTSLAGNLADVQLALTADNGMTSLAGLTNSAVFTNVEGTNDLLYAEYDYETPAVISAAPAKVKFQFAHLLSKVKFSFTNGFVNKNTTVVVKDITMAVPATGEIDLTADELAWANQAGNLVLAMGHMNGGQNLAVNASESSDNERLTIPATAAQEYTVNFTVEIWNGAQMASSTPKEVKISGVELKMGHSYNFKATLNQDNAYENPLFPIEFEAEVDEWVEETFDTGVAAGDVVVVNTIEELQAAVNAEATVSVVLGSDLVGNVVVPETAGETKYINGNGHTFNGYFQINGKSDYKNATTVFNNINFVTEDASALLGDSFIYCGEATGTSVRYPDNVTVKNCTFTATGAAVEKAVAIKFWSQKGNLVVEGCKATDMHSLMQLTSCGNAVVTVDGVEVENCKNGISLQLVAKASIKNSTIKTNGYGVRGEGCTAVVDIATSTIEAPYPFVVRKMKANSNYVLNVDAETELVTDGVYKAVFTTGSSDESDFVAPAEGTYTFNCPVNHFYFPAVTAVATAEEFAAAVKQTNENISIVLANDIDVAISDLGQQTGGSGEYKLGGENTENFTINLNGHNLNITTTYWSNLGAKNDNAIFTIKNGSMTSSQASGTWNSYDLCFSNCNYNFEDVVFEKAIALEGANKAYNLKNVTINETHDYYAMWISAKGQTVTVDGLTVNSAGRGVKIDEQYVSAPAKVTLNVANATFKTAKKAAVVVKSAEGAEINWGAGNSIAEVVADQDFAVWVDEDSAAVADKVVVNGALCKVEGAAVAAADTDTELREALKAGNDVILTSDITTTDAESNGNGATGININGGVFDGNGHTIAVEGATSTWDSAIAIKGGTIKNLTVAKGFRGIFIKKGTEKVVLENVVVKGPTYTISCDQAGKQGLEAYNSKFYGWTSYAATLGTAYFEGCTFGSGAGYNFSRPYAPTTYVNCTFEAGHAIDARAAVSFENCTFKGVALTSENIATLVTGNVQNVQEVK